MVSNLNKACILPVNLKRIPWNKCSNHMSAKRLYLEDGAPYGSFLKYDLIIGENFPITVAYGSTVTDGERVVRNKYIIKKPQGFKDYLIFSPTTLYLMNKSSTELIINPSVDLFVVAIGPFHTAQQTTATSITKNSIVFSMTGELLEGTPSGDNYIYPAGTKIVVGGMGSLIDRRDSLGVTDIPMNKEPRYIFGKVASGKPVFCEFRTTPTNSLKSERITESVFYGLDGQLAGAIAKYFVLYDQISLETTPGLRYLDTVDSINDLDIDFYTDIFSDPKRHLHHIGIEVKPWSDNIDNHLSNVNYMRDIFYPVDSIAIGDYPEQSLRSHIRYPHLRYSKTTRDFLIVPEGEYTEVANQSVVGDVLFQYSPIPVANTVEFINAPPKMFVSNSYSEYYLDSDGLVVEDNDGTLKGNINYKPLTWFEYFFSDFRPYVIDDYKNYLLTPEYSDIHEDILIFHNNRLMFNNNSFLTDGLTIETFDYHGTYIYVQNTMVDREDIYMWYDPSVEVVRIDPSILDQTLLSKGIIKTNYFYATDIVYVNGVRINSKNEFLNMDRTKKLGVDRIVLASEFRDATVEEIVILRPRSTYVKTIYEAYKSVVAGRISFSPDNYTITESVVTPRSLSNPPYIVDEDPTHHALYLILLNIMMRIRKNPHGVTAETVEAYLQPLKDKFAILSVNNLYGLGMSDGDRLVLSGEGSTYRYIIEGKLTS